MVIADSVGVISVGDIQIIVHPKVPLNHFLYLLQRSGRVPRHGSSRISLASGATLWELLSLWFVDTAEAVIRTDLLRDYEECEEILGVIRGTLDPEPTGRAFYGGRLEFSCRFDDFTYDTPLSRAIKGACNVVMADPSLSWSLRRRSLALWSCLDEVGELRIGDELWEPSARYASYWDAYSLAQNVLSGSARVFAEGAASGRAFLLRTPPLIEDGIRNVLSQALPGLSFRRSRLALGTSRVTVNPDLLVNEGAAVADVKYKLFVGDWNRADLYEVVAFAVAYGSRRAGLVNFCLNDEPTLETLPFGDIEVAHLPWNARENIDPERAEAAFKSAVAAWAGPASDERLPMLATVGSTA